MRRKFKLLIDAVDDLPHVEQATQRNLRRLFGGLRDILVRLPEDRAVEAEMVAEQAKALLECASQQRLNQTMILSSSAGLRQAAERLDDIAPRVLTLCRQVTEQFD